ncbi:universal stress protein [Salinisphaera sp. USBA-960]|uniref:universal stress protein n=1 Tax=Salinisphaera orenii TaxID=856731 RepID=UPI000DBE7DEC|nr:universal stress protein [Salifodinibacter halophilus]NNC26888.1 universal stress protein [Salifodinibacter halophilus]
MQNFETILLAYDGSERGRVALRRCLPLMDSNAVTIHLLAVVPLAGAVAAADGFYTESMYEAERDRIQQILDDGVNRLQSHGITATGYLRAGEPAHQIADLATELSTDLVVVGHQRRGLLSRWWRGSVGASLLDRLDCCLLVAQACDEELPDAAE